MSNQLLSRSGQGSDYMVKRGRQAIDHRELSKTISHALRHEPWLYELELDDEGWTPYS